MDIVIDWFGVASEAEFYELLLPQLAAPDWHGRNLDALSDSFEGDAVKGIEVVYIEAQRGDPAEQP